MIDKAAIHVLNISLAFFLLERERERDGLPVPELQQVSREACELH